MQGPGGPTEDVTGGFDEGGWVFKLWDEGAGDAIGALFAGEYELLLGRRPTTSSPPIGPMWKAKARRWVRRSPARISTC